MPVALIGKKVSSKHRINAICATLSVFVEGVGLCAYVCRCVCYECFRFCSTVYAL